MGRNSWDSTAWNDDNWFQTLETDEELRRKRLENDLDPYPERSLGLVEPEPDYHETTEEEQALSQTRRISQGRLHTSYHVSFPKIKR